MVIRVEPAPVILETQPVVRCRHYWIIEPAQGPVSQGKCQTCQEVREFQNSIVEAEREF